eukprot:TRINITY_DN70420_c0_g1_i1.p1 TRINITY_DN70420_c0_g1~~TRINITY_DN70420_c0_g1_i1.p1  ORF type:complete len:483 (+),score=96.40 TRINITY_DN70420_c0_g1_i1:98-1546(+)
MHPQSGEPLKARLDRLLFDLGLCPGGSVIDRVRAIADALELRWASVEAVVANAEAVLYGAEDASAPALHHSGAKPSALGEQELRNGMWLQGGSTSPVESSSPSTTRRSSRGGTPSFGTSPTRAAEGASSLQQADARDPSTAGSSPAEPTCSESSARLVEELVDAKRQAQQLRHKLFESELECQEVHGSRWTTQKAGLLSSHADTLLPGAAVDGGRRAQSPGQLMGHRWVSKERSVVLPVHYIGPRSSGARSSRTNTPSHSPYVAQSRQVRSGTGSLLETLTSCDISGLSLPSTPPRSPYLGTGRDFAASLQKTGLWAAGEPVRGMGYQDGRFANGSREGQVLAGERLASPERLPTPRPADLEVIKPRRRHLDVPPLSPRAAMERVSARPREDLREYAVPQTQLSDGGSDSSRPSVASTDRPSLLWAFMGENPDAALVQALNDGAAALLRQQGAEPRAQPATRRLDSSFQAAEPFSRFETPDF